MSHLTLETIARLVDEAASQQEAEHLEACRACARELEDMRADSAVLAGLPPLEPPARAWGAIEARLSSEGLMRPADVRGFAWRGALLRMAATIAIFALGALAGIAWNDAPAEPALSAAQQDTEPLGLRPIEPGPLTQPPQSAPAASQVRDTQPAPLRAGSNAGVQLASALVTAREPRNSEEAARLMREVEALYYQALIRLAEAAPTAESGDPLTRLAVLQGITTLTGAALGQAPADPILNGYHLAALAQREATLRQIAARTADSWF
jgi:hypothetical protein